MTYAFAGFVGIGLETTWGTPVAATDYIEILSESMAITFDRYPTKNIVATYFEPETVTGLQRAEGDIVFHAHPGQIGHVLKGLFGQSSVTSNHANCQVNVFTPRTSDSSSLNPLPGYTLEINRDVTSSFRYAGVQFTQAAISVAPNQDVRFTVGAIAKAQDFIDGSTATFPSTPIHPFTFDTASLQLGGSGIDRIEALTVTFANNLEGLPTLNATNTITKVRRTGPLTVRVSGTVEFTDLSDFLNFQNETEQQLIAYFTRADSFSLKIDVPRTVFTALPVQLTGRDRVTADFEMEGRYHTGSAQSIEVTLTTLNSY